MEILLSKLYDIDKISLYDKYISMFRDPSSVDIKKVLPDTILEQYNIDCEELLKEIDFLDSEKYIDKFLDYKEFLEKLEEIKINSIAYKAFCEIESNETILSTLRSFKPVKGFTNKVNYNLTGTITGRLIVTKNSPKVLTLPSRCRKIFESSFGSEGKLYNIDFVSLEPRVARKVLGKKCKNDIYEEIKEDLDMIIDRSIIKKAIISVLYGKYSDIEGISKEKSKIILRRVNEYFSIIELYKIANQIHHNKFRKNFYGRPILNLNEEKTNKIINNLIQSTAVDISLMYFSSITKLFNNKIRPLFVLHDAFIVDVHNDYSKEFISEVKKGFTCQKLGYFPVEIKEY
jgi:hypothetical protein